MSELCSLDLFAGIGGFSLGLEWAGGFRTIGFAEVHPFCLRLLAERWPGVPCFGDVRTLSAAEVGAVDVITAGFPCQDISNANAAWGDLAGIDGERSGLWTDCARLVRDLRPEYVVLENSAALLARGLGRVLGDLAALGYDAEWHCIPASAVGAPHDRDRVWIVAYPVRLGSQGGAATGDDHAPRRPILTRGSFARALVEGAANRGRWTNEPAVGRVADGIPDRVHRLHALGNAVVPQIPELIGRAILAHREEAA